MTIDETALNSLRAICPGAQLLAEGGKQYIFLPQLKITVDNAIRQLDGLLCPGEHSGYLTRLFLSEPIPSKAQNWTQWTILGRLWHSWSWQGVEASLPLPRMLLEHLRALR